MKRKNKQQEKGDPIKGALNLLGIIEIIAFAIMIIARIWINDDRTEVVLINMMCTDIVLFATTFIIYCILYPAEGKSKDDE